MDQKEYQFCYDVVLQTNGVNKQVRRTGKQILSGELRYDLTAHREMVRILNQQWGVGIVVPQDGLENKGHWIEDADGNVVT